MDYQEEYNQMMKEGRSNTQNFRYLIIAVIAFVLGFGSAWISFKSQDGNVAVQENNDNGRVEADVKLPSNNSSNNSNNEENKEEVVVTGSVTLNVSNQAPGKSVFVKEVNAPKAVWVVIVENNDGIKGNILGAGLFDPEETGGLVELLRGTVEGGKYYAVLHSEDSELQQNRTFDLENDLPILDQNGNLVEVVFMTTSLPAEN